MKTFSPTHSASSFSPQTCMAGTRPMRRAEETAWEVTGDTWRRMVGGLFSLCISPSASFACRCVDLRFVHLEKKAATETLSLWKKLHKRERISNSPHLEAFLSEALTFQQLYWSCSGRQQEPAVLSGSLWQEGGSSSSPSKDDIKEWMKLLVSAGHLWCHRLNPAASVTDI